MGKDKMNAFLKGNSENFDYEKLNSILGISNASADALFKPPTDFVGKDKQRSDITDKVIETGSGFTGPMGTAGSMLGGIAGKALTTNKPKSQIGSTAAKRTIQGAGMGAAGGPYGVAIGAAVGLTVGLVEGDMNRAAMERERRRRLKAFTDQNKQLSNRLSSLYKTNKLSKQSQFYI